MAGSPSGARPAGRPAALCPEAKWSQAAWSTLATAVGKGRPQGPRVHPTCRHVTSPPLSSPCRWDQREGTRAHTEVTAATGARNQPPGPARPPWERGRRGRPATPPDSHPRHASPPHPPSQPADIKPFNDMKCPSLSLVIRLYLKVSFVWCKSHSVSLMVTHLFLKEVHAHAYLGH